MRILLVSLLLAFPQCLCYAIQNNATLNTVSEFNSKDSYDCGKWQSFELSGTVIANMGEAFLLEDKTGRTRIVWPSAETKPQPGSRIRLSGSSTALVDRGYFCRIETKDLALTCIGKGEIPDFSPMSVSELRNTREDFLIVKTEGTISDVIFDDIDTRTAFLILRDGESKITVDAPVHTLEKIGTRKLIGSKVHVYGIFVQNLSGYRLYFGPHLSTSGQIEIVDPAPEDPFDAPDLSLLQTIDPRLISTCSPHSVKGTVLALTDEHTFVLLNDLARVVNVSLSAEVKPPNSGQRVLVVGNPCTDLYHINLSQAVWRPEPGAECRPKEPRTLTLARALFDSSSIYPSRSDYHGQLIRLRGIVQRLPHSAPKMSALYIESDGYSIPINFPPSEHASPGIAIGTTIDATGIWAFNIDNWRPDAILPRIKGGSLNLRRSNDIAIVAKPSKWNSRHLLWVLGGITAIVIVLIVWNLFLNRAVAKKTKELKHEEVARLGETMRVDERTRLATELHDSLLQTLSGVTFQIDAADRARRLDPSQLEKYIIMAKQTLSSCQSELRNCIWDLRNHALDGSDTEEAIRTAIKPFLPNAAVDLDFDVPRTNISDSTFHAIICIVRELAINAVKHGKATTISVSGQYDGKQLEITVSDNGCGFNPDAHPGSDEGHFGIQGIQERLRLIGGTLAFNSKSGTGTTATVTIKGANHEQN